MTIRIVSAHTVYPNTPETDLMPQVLHQVGVNVNGTHLEVRLMARDPLDAGDIVRDMSEQEIEALPRA